MAQVEKLIDQPDSRMARKVKFGVAGMTTGGALVVLLIEPVTAFTGWQPSPQWVAAAGVCMTALFGFVGMYRARERKT